MTKQSLVVVGVVVGGFACGGDTTTPSTPSPGQTTPGFVPVGAYPPIPLPLNAGGTTVTRSDSVNTTIMTLATDFNPIVLAIAGNWNVGQQYKGIGAILTCFNTVVNGPASSDAIVYAAKQVDCPVVEGGAYRYVVYPPRGTFVSNWLATHETRILLMEAGLTKAGASLNLIPEHLFAPYVGDIVDFVTVLRDACDLEGTHSSLNGSCVWTPRTTASVQWQPLATPVYLRRDVYWEKAGDSAIFPNYQAGSNSQSTTRSWTAGIEQAETEQFGRSVTGELGLSYSGLGAKVGGTISQTFGTSVTVSQSQTVSETYQMTIAGNTTAVFEIWNLQEQYTFVNADGTPYEDPNYTFSVPDLTRRATIATARTSIEFPN
jgi:hypothetical protein